MEEFIKWAADFASQMNGYTLAFLGVLATFTLAGKKVFGFFKWIVNLFKKVDVAMDTLAGRPEHKDPMTGKTIAAYAPLGHRLATIEDTLKVLADNQSQMLHLEARFQEHHEWAERWTREHDEQVIVWNEDHGKLWDAISDIENKLASS